METDDNKIALDIFRQSVQSFLKKEVLPFVDDWEKDERIPKDIYQKMGEMGLLGLDKPIAYGGLALEFTYSKIFCEELGKIPCGGFSIATAVIAYMSASYINSHGSAFLKEQFLSPTISGHYISSIAITEPSGGSDVQNIKTTATKHESHYEVNGSKTFITNGVYGDYMVVAVKTPTAHHADALSLLVIQQQMKGVKVKKIKKLGWHASDTAEVFFDQVQIPKSHLIGEEGMGFSYLMEGLCTERLIGSILGISSAQAALDYALEYMDQREAFGKKLNKFQVLRHRIADIVCEIEINRIYVDYCCSLKQNEADLTLETAIAKLKCSETALKTIDQCLQFFGGYGYTEDFKIARMYRDARVGTIGGGTSEIMLEIISKIHLSKKPTVTI
ncbi:MAG: acyl-CoA dehydrogenase family protein [Flavobacterium sp.]|nr:acyl-CoA dehydrogenase family protein [Candidatus Neoflavobacterium equi]